MIGLVLYRHFWRVLLYKAKALCQLHEILAAWRDVGLLYLTGIHHFFLKMA